MGCGPAITGFRGAGRGVGLSPKGSRPKGSRVTDIGFVSGSPETDLQPQWSTFLVRASFSSPKGAALWTVDWQFQKEWIPWNLYRKQWAMAGWLAGWQPIVYSKTAAQLTRV